MTTLYHVSPTYNRGTILKKGLRIDMDESGHRAIFLWENIPPTSISYDIWEIDAQGLEVDVDVTEGAPEDSWMYYGDIPEFRVFLRKGTATQGLGVSTVLQI
jgi:hypothetical protein